MRFTVGRTEVSVSFAVLPFFLWCILIGEGAALLCGSLSLLVHECAHLIAARNLGRETAAIRIHPIGAVIRFRNEQSDPKAEWIVAAAGPLGSFAFAAFLDLIRSASGIGSEAVGMLQRTSTAIALLNLIPAFPLDGGRVAKTLLCRILKERTAKRIALGFTCLCACTFAAIGIVLLTKGILTAWTLVALPVFLLSAAAQEWKTPEPGVIGDVLDRTRAIRSGGSRKAEFVVLSSEATVGDAVSAISSSKITFLRIVDENAIYEISETDLLRAAGRIGYEGTLKSLISSLTLRKHCVIIH